MKTYSDRAKEAIKRLQQEYGHFRIARHHPGDATSSDPYLYSNGKRTKICVPWVYSDTTIMEDKEYNHRAVMPFEVVWETDDPDTTNNLVSALNVLHRLRDNGIVASLWFSGGKSYHLHAFFKPDDRIKDVRFFKQFIHQYFSGGEKFDEQLLGNHLVRTEWGTHEMSGKNKVLLFGPEVPFLNVLTEEIILFFQECQLIEEVKQLHKHWLVEQTRRTIPNCVWTFFSGEFYKLNDGKQRALFVLVGTLVPALGPDAALEKLREWNKHNKKPFNDGLLVAKVKYELRMHKRMGCRYRHEVLQELGLSFSCGTVLNSDVGKEVVGEPLCHVEKPVRT